MSTVLLNVTKFVSENLRNLPNLSDAKASKESKQREALRVISLTRFKVKAKWSGKRWVRTKWVPTKFYSYKPESQDQRDLKNAIENPKFRYRYRRQYAFIKKRTEGGSHLLFLPAAYRYTGRIGVTHQLTEAIGRITGASDKADLRSGEGDLQKVIAGIRAAERFVELKKRFIGIFEDPKYKEVIKTVLAAYKKDDPKLHARLSSIIKTFKERDYLFFQEMKGLGAKVDKLEKEINAIMPGFMRDVDAAIANGGWCSVEHVRIRRRLEKWLGKDHPQLMRGVIRIWKEKWFDRHREAVYLLGRTLAFNDNKETRLKLKAYLTDLVKFGGHYGLLEALNRSLLSGSKEKREAAMYAIDVLSRSKDEKKRKLGARLKAAIEVLRGYNQYNNMLRPLGVEGERWGFKAADLGSRISRDQTKLGITKGKDGRLKSVFDDPRFLELAAAKYRKSDEFKSQQGDRKLAKRVVDAERLIQDLKSKDAKKRQAALAKFRMMVARTTFDEFTKYSGSHDLGGMAKLVPETFNEYNRSDVDDDVCKLTIKSNSSDTPIPKQWHVRKGSTLKTDVRDIHRVLNFFRKYLSEAKDVDKKIIRMAEEFARGRARNALVRPLENINLEISAVNGIEDGRLSQLILKISTETDLKKLFELHSDAQFIAQSGLILAQIKALRMADKDVSRLVSVDSSLACWTARLMTAGIWWPKGVELSGVTLDSLARAEQAVLKARKLFDKGINRGNKYEFLKLMRKAQNEMMWANKSIKNDKSMTEGFDANFMRVCGGLYILGLTIAITAGTCGFAAAAFPGIFAVEGSFASAAALFMLEVSTFTALGVASSYVIYKEEVTPWTVTEDLFWNTIMFGAFGRLGKGLKSMAGIRAVAKDVPEGLLKKLLARHGMERLTARNLGKIMGRELGVLTAEAAAFQAFEGYKATIRAAGLTARPVHDYIAEMKALATFGAAAHGLGNLAAIKLIGYGSGKVTQRLLRTKAMMKLHALRLEAGIKRCAKVLEAFEAGEITLSPLAEARLARQMFHNTALLHAMSGRKPGSLAYMTYARMMQADAKVKSGSTVQVGEALGLNKVDAAAFERAVKKSGMCEAEVFALAQAVTEIETAYRTKGLLPKPKLELVEFMLNRKLKSLGFVVRDGKLMSGEMGKLAEAIDGFLSLPAKEKARIVGGAAAVIAGIFLEPITTSFLALGMAVGSCGKKKTLDAYRAKLGDYNERLKEYDVASGKKRTGKELTAAEEGLLGDAKLKKLDGERVEFVKKHFEHHDLVSAKAEGSPIRSHLEAHIGDVDLGSTVDVKRFGGAEDLISFSENLLARAYKGELKPGTQVEVVLSPKGQEPLKGRVRVMRTGENIDGVDVGPSETGGRLVIEVKFDHPIGKEGVVELKDGQRTLEVDRNSGGRTDRVKLVEGEKADTNTIYIIGGSYGPTGKFGLYTVYSGKYAPPISDTAYWGRRAFVTGERSSWKVEGGRVVVREGTRMAEMIKDGKVGIEGPKLSGNGKRVKAEEGFGEKVRTAVGAFFQSGLRYFFARSNGAPKEVADRLVQSGSDVFEGAPTKAEERAIDLVSQHSSDPVALAQIQTRIFASENASCIMRRLASEKVEGGKTLLEILIPELEGKRIEQDGRYHKGQDVLDHLVESVEVMDGLIAGNSSLSPKQKALLRMVALYHDIGKHDDPSGTHLGRKKVESRNGRDVISFPGHQAYGARLFEDIVRSRINPNLPEGQRFTDAEIALGRHLVATHMRAVELIHAMKDGKVKDKALTRYIRELCIDNQQLLQMGIPLETIVESVLLVNEMDIRAASDYAGKKETVSRFQSIAQTIRSRLGDLKKKIMRSATDPLVDGADVMAAMGTKKGGPVVGEIVNKILDLQVEGKLFSREEALHKVADMVRAKGMEVDPGFVAASLQVPVKSNRMLRHEIAGESQITDADGNVVATVRFYRMNAVAQLVALEGVEQVRHRIESGNYVETRRALESGEITAKTVYDAMRSGGVRNLRAFEELIKSMRKGGTELGSLAYASGVATLPVIEIVRADGTRIAIKGGYQSTVEHNAIGGFHLAAQRLADIREHFKKPGETLQDTLSRFMEEAVKVLATSKVEIPSNRDPNTVLMFGRINGGQQYVSIVVDKNNPDQWSVVTVMFRPTKKTMRKELAMYALRQLKNKVENREPLSKAEYAKVLENVNAFLKKEGLEPITIGEICGLDDPDAPGTGKEQIRKAIEAKGYTGKKLRKMLGEVERNCATFKEAMKYVRTKVAEVDQPKQKGKGGKGKSGPALYAELLDAKGFDKKEKGKHMGKIMGMVKAKAGDAEIQAYIDGLKAVTP